MILDLLIKFHKRKISKLIEKDADYNIILKEEKILDKYVIKKMFANY